MKRRSIAGCILATIFTCGIYGLFWIYDLTNDINFVSKEDDGTSGGMVVLLSIVTCGVYTVYWAYKMGGKIDTIKSGPDGQQKKDSSILYLILALCNYFTGISFLILLAIMQDDLNKIIDNC